MKNNYGFTLIELLAIVVILGVIIAVAAPNMTKQINKKEETDQTILDEKISNASHMYIAKYYSDKVVGGTCDSSTCSFTLNDLEQDRLMQITWGKSKADDKYTAVIKIFAKMGPSTLSSITNKLSENKINIKYIYSDVTKNNDAVYNIGIEVKNKQELNDFVNKLKSMQEVYDVLR